MIDVIVFSKNRACQLYNLLDTLSTSVKGVNNIFVQYRETNERYAEGYQKLRNVFGSNVIFIDEKEHGFATTLAAILANEVTSEVVVTETDDSFFINDLDVIYCARVLLANAEIGRYQYQTDSKLFSNHFYKEEEGHFLIEKAPYTGERTPIELCLAHSFNVGGTLNRSSDMLELIMTHHDITNPVDLERMGATSQIFRKYPFNALNKTECSIMLHLNNFFDRYEQFTTTDILNDMILKDEVLDIDIDYIKSLERDKRWIFGDSVKIKYEDGRQFPIFPWEVAPKYHKEICRQKKELS